MNIHDYNYTFNKELIKYRYNPFTSKMITDLDIKFYTIIDNNFYITRYNTNKRMFI